jgi:hypothetical protein
VRIACIVEGDGEVEAVPELVRRIARDLAPPAFVDAVVSQRISRSRLAGKPPHLERAIEFAARKAGSGGAILIALDADDDCPKTLAPALLGRAHAIRSDLPIAVVLAKYEYEAWLLASAASLRGQHGLAAELAPPAEPEAIRDAKGWLTEHMPRGRPYKEPLHQLQLTKLLEPALARSAPSFDKLYREVQSLIGAARYMLPG